MLLSTVVIYSSIFIAQSEKQKHERNHFFNFALIEFETLTFITSYSGTAPFCYVLVSQKHWGIISLFLFFAIELHLCP